MNQADAAGLSGLPSITALLKAAESHAGLRDVPASRRADVLREAVEEARRSLRAGGDRPTSVSSILDRAAAIARAFDAARLTSVVNATGIVLHTGLGRSVLAQAAIERLTGVASGYCNLEIDLPSGRRGRRGEYAERLLCRLTGAQATMIVNNNAAATMLVLGCLARGREVIVSRGQLIEIGGSFRLPEIMTAGGAILREVGTTNKTHLRDYESAISAATAMIMHVHTSNYRVVGFAESPDVAELARLAHARGLLMVDDLGSGALLNDELWKVADEPTVTASLAAGADLVAFSGDKLLGGPQAGVLLGRSDIIDRLRRDPMARALRVGKLTIAALEATLELYESPDSARRHVPVLAALADTIDAIRSRAEELCSRLRSVAPTESFEIIEEESFAGGGSLPAWPLPTAVVRWTRSGGRSVDDTVRGLRTATPAVLCRVREGAVLFDVRTIRREDFEAVAAAVAEVAGWRPPDRPG